MPVNRLTVSDLSLSASSTALGERVAVDLSAAVGGEEGRGALSGSLQLSRPLSDVPAVSGEARLTDLPARTLDELLETRGRIEQAIGQTLSLRVDGAWSVGATGVQGEAGDDAPGATASASAGSSSSSSSSSTTSASASAPAPGSGGGRLSVVLESAQAHATLSGPIRDGWWRARGDSPWRWRVDPGFLASFRNDLLLREPAEAELTLAQLSIPLGIGAASEGKAGSRSGPALSQIQVGATLAFASPLSLEGAGPWRVENLRLTWPDAALSEPRTVELSGTVVESDRQGRLSGELELAGLSESFAPRRASVRAGSTPTALVASLSGRDDLSTWLGPVIESLDASVKLEPLLNGGLAGGEGDGPSATPFSVRWRSAAMAAEVSGRFVPGRSVTIADGSMLDYRLTPERFAALARENPYQLAAPATLSLRPHRLAIDLAEKRAEPFELTLRSPALRFEKPEVAAARSPDAAGPSPSNVKPARADGFGAGREEPGGRDVEGESVVVELSDVRLKASGRDVRESLSLALSSGIRRSGPGGVTGRDQAGSGADVAKAGDESATGRLTAEVSVQEPIGVEGSLQLAEARWRYDARADALPIDLIDAILAQDGLLTALVGERSNVSAQGTFPGSTRLSFAGDRAELSLDGRIDEAGTLRLNEPLTAQLTVTPALSERVLEQIHPVLGDVKGSSAPVRLTASPEGFAFPVRPFELDRLSMRGRLELGTVEMDSSGWVSEGLAGLTRELLNRRGRSGDRARRFGEGRSVYRVTFTPLSFEIQDQLVRSSEVWMTGKDVGVGFQGRADLRTQQLNLVMGVVGATLVSAGGDAMYGFLKLDDVVDVPVGGTIENPKIDRGWVVTQLVGSTASAQLGRVSREAQAIFDLFGEAVVKGGKRRQLGVRWNPPEEAAQVIAYVRSRQAPPSAAGPDEPGGSEDSAAREGEQRESDGEDKSQRPQSPEQRLLETFRQLIADPVEELGQE